MKTPRPYRDPAPPTPAIRPPRDSSLGCFAILSVIGCTLGSIAYAFMQPRPGVLVAAMVVVLAIPTLGLTMRRMARQEERAELFEEARLRAIAPPRGNAWEALLRAHGFESDIEAIRPHVRPAVRLVFERTEEHLGNRSRSGGEPTLPPGVAWPRDETPMQFVLQIDLAEVHAARSDLPLPGEGTLYVFESDGGDWRTFIAPPGERVRASSPPNGLPPYERRCRITFEAYDDLPPTELLGATAEAWHDGQHDQYDKLAAYLAGSRFDANKLFGHANPIQNLEEIEHDGSRRLVLQLDSTSEAGWTWGDAGRMYFTVTTAALEARDFSKIDAVGQCT